MVAKPGIVVGNVLATLGGFLLASEHGVDKPTLFAAVFGTLFVIAASCVVNNYLDRDIDRKMTRTAKRPSVTGVLPLRVGIIYATFLYILGFGVLLWQTNILTAVIGFVGALFYTVVYGYAKRHTHHATLIGALPGATPPLAGYVAATGHIDLTASVLFLAMLAWQMPHFYAIGLRRLKQYQAAHIPVLPAVKGLSRTVWEMRAYALLFLLSCYLLAHYAQAGFMFGLAMLMVSVYWFQPIFSPNWRSQTTQVATTVFKRSLTVLFAFCIFLALSHVLL